jgi:hypothetical protein
MAYRKTVMVENLNGLGTAQLRTTFLALFRDQVDAVEVLPNTSKLNSLISDRLALLKKYENLVAKRHYFQEKSRYFLQHWEPSTGMTLSKSDQALSARHIKSASEDTRQVLEEGKTCETEKILDIYLNAIQVLSEEIEEEADAVKTRGNSLDVAFVKFKTSAARQVALSTRLFNGNKLSLSEAPDANDIIWENMYQSRTKMDYARYIFSTVLALGVLIVIPFGFVVSGENGNRKNGMTLRICRTIIAVCSYLAGRFARCCPPSPAFVNVELLSCFDWLNIDPNDLSSFEKSLIQGLVPPVMWLVFMSIAYFIIKLGATHIVKFRTYTAVNAFTFRNFYL